MECGEVSREGVVRDAATGELFIPATRRADGTWRKARRVREGYVPQEEVPVFETKGTHWLKNQPTGPVGLHVDEKSENSMSKTAKKNAKRKEKKKQQQKCNEPVTGGSTSVDVVPPGGHSLHKTSPGSNNGRLASGETKCDSMKDEADRDATKRMRNLRKKLKQIDDIQRRIDSGENLEKDQLEKVSRRQVVADELEELMLHLNVED